MSIADLVPTTAPGFAFRGSQSIFPLCPPSGWSNPTVGSGRHVDRTPTDATSRPERPPCRHSPEPGTETDVPDAERPRNPESEASHAQLAKQGEVELSLKRTPPDNGADELAVPPIGLPPLAGPEAQGTLPTALTGRAQFSLCVGLWVCVKPRLANTPSSASEQNPFRYPYPSLGPRWPTLMDHVAGSEDLTVAMATCEAACRHWPGETITLRQGAQNPGQSPRRLGMTTRGLLLR